MARCWAGAYAEAAEDWLDDTDVDRVNAAAAEQGAAVGLVAGLVPGLVVGWLIAPAFDDIVNRSQSAIGVAFIGAAIGLAIGSFAGMGRARARCNAPVHIDRSQTIEGGRLRASRLIRRSATSPSRSRHPHPDR